MDHLRMFASALGAVAFLAMVYIMTFEPQVLDFIRGQ